MTRSLIFKFLNKYNNIYKIYKKQNNLYYEKKFCSVKIFICSGERSFI